MTGTVAARLKELGIALPPPAKVLGKAASALDKLKLKGGYLAGAVLDTKGVDNLAKMKGKNELRADLLALFIAPATGFVQLLNAGPQNFMYLLSARERSMGKE